MRNKEHIHWSVQHRYDYWAIDQYAYPIEFFDVSADPDSFIAESWMRLTNGPVITFSSKKMAENVCSLINEAYWLGINGGVSVAEMIEEYEP